MGDRISSVALAIVTGVTAVAIITNKHTRGTVQALGGTFVGSLRQISKAGQ